MRTRGQLVCSLDGTAAPGLLVVIGIGLIVVPQGQGTTVIWSPISDGNAPWFYFSRFVVGYEEAVTDVIDVPGLSSYRETVDSKAMRRSLPDTEVQCVVENATLNGGMNVSVSLQGRILVGN
jgi:hypothetical protein